MQYKKQAASNDTLEFQIQFVFQDALVYVGLFLAIRSDDWHLRIASMEEMAALLLLLTIDLSEINIPTLG